MGRTSNRTKRTENEDQKETEVGKSSSLPLKNSPLLPAAVSLLLIISLNCQVDHMPGDLQEAMLEKNPLFSDSITKFFLKVFSP